MCSRFVVTNITNTINILESGGLGGSCPLSHVNVIPVTNFLWPPSSSSSTLPGRRDPQASSMEHAKVCSCHDFGQLVANHYAAILLNTML
jgi:hypothetical protein